MDRKAIAKVVLRLLAALGDFLQVTEHPAKEENLKSELQAACPVLTLPAGLLVFIEKDSPKKISFEATPQGKRKKYPAN